MTSLSLVDRRHRRAGAERHRQCARPDAAAARGGDDRGPATVARLGAATGHRPARRSGRLRRGRAPGGPAQRRRPRQSRRLDRPPRSGRRAGAALRRLDLGGGRVGRLRHHREPMAGRHDPAAGRTGCVAVLRAERSRSRTIRPRSSAGTSGTRPAALRRISSNTSPTTSGFASSPPGGAASPSTNRSWCAVRRRRQGAHRRQPA